jgi:hypothetical protein
MLKQYDEVLSASRAAMSNADFWNQQNASNEMQKMKGALVDAQIAALAAGKILAPPATGAADLAASTLGWASGILPEPGSAGERHLEAAGKWGLGGALLGGILGIPGGPAGIAGGAALGGTVFGSAGYAADKVRDLGAAAVEAATGLWKLLFPGSPAPAGSGDAKAGEKQSLNLIPPKDSRPIVVSSVIKLDGETIAQNTQEHLADATEHSTTAPFADGTRYPWGGDMQTNSR